MNMSLFLNKQLRFYIKTKKFLKSKDIVELTLASLRIPYSMSIVYKSTWNKGSVGYLSFVFLESHQKNINNIENYYINL